MKKQMKMMKQQQQQQLLFTCFVFKARAVAFQLFLDGSKQCQLPRGRQRACGCNYNVSHAQTLETGQTGQTRAWGQLQLAIVRAAWQVQQGQQLGERQATCLIVVPNNCNGL